MASVDVLKKGEIMVSFRGRRTGFSNKPSMMIAQHATHAERGKSAVSGGGGMLLAVIAFFVMLIALIVSIASTMWH